MLYTLVGLLFSLRVGAGSFLLRVKRLENTTHTALPLQVVRLVGRRCDFFALGLARKGQVRSCGTEAAVARDGRYKNGFLLNGNLVSLSLEVPPSPVVTGAPVAFRNTFMKAHRNMRAMQAVPHR